MSGHGVPWPKEARFPRPRPSLPGSSIVGPVPRPNWRSYRTGRICRSQWRAHRFDWMSATISNIAGILDLRQAILWREWRHQDASGRVTRVRELRLASLADRRLLIQSISFSPENYSGVVSIDAMARGSLTELTATGATVALAAATRFVDFESRAIASEDLATPQSLRVDLGKLYRFDRVVAICISRDAGDPGATAREHADHAIATDLTALIENHRHAWMERWRACDLRIDGDSAAQRALRFAMYHLLSAANPDDERVSIGARALTGSAYKGHVFWDTEIFMLPFFTLT